MRLQEPAIDGRTEAIDTEPRSPLCDEIHTDQNHYHARLGRQLRADAMANHAHLAWTWMTHWFRGLKRQST